MPTPTNQPTNQPNTMNTAAAELKRALIVHLDLGGELPTFDKLTKLVNGVETTTGEPLTLADIIRTTRDAVTTHADTQTGNALDTMRNALNRYEQTDVSDTQTTWHQLQRMQAALDTLKAMEIFRL